jgi:GNAT superfamily N-acetyltransferase
MRPVEPSDAGKLVAGLQRLSPESRVARFFYAKEELTPLELQRFTERNPDRHIALGLAITDDSDHELDAVGIVHCFRDGPGSSSGEVAFAVVDEWQHLGIGTALIQQLALHCWNRGIRSWRATFLQKNRAPVKLLARVADNLITRETAGGALTVECRLRSPASKVSGAAFEATFRAGGEADLAD